MLYAPAECDHCGVVFGSGAVIAEHPGAPSSYRRAADPCPQRGGRGSVPEWVFRFHATAAGARDQAALALTLSKPQLLGSARRKRPRRHRSHRRPGHTAASAGATGQTPIPSSTCAATG